MCGGRLWFALWVRQIRPVFEETLREFGVEQKLVPQPRIYLGMWPAWLRGTSLERGVVSPSSTLSFDWPWRRAKKSR